MGYVFEKQKVTLKISQLYKTISTAAWAFAQCL